MNLNFALRALSFVLAISVLPGALGRENAALATNSNNTENDLYANVAPPGPIVNGISLQGPVLQGPVLQGPVLQGTRLNSVVVNGFAERQQLVLRGGELIAFPRRGLMIGGEDLEGATLEGVLSDDTTISFRIDEVAGTTDSEIFEYTVSYWDGLTWANLCGEQNGVPVRALALEGRWDESSGTATGGDHIDDPNVFTFACKNAVLAKCVVLGYAPWRSITECNGDECQTIEMRDMHQACTRMMRADYCGDGTPHTQNGTTINAWDNFAIQTPDTNLPVQWTDEAEWTPEGARSILQVRWSGTAESYIDSRCPDRWASEEASGFALDSTFFTAHGFETASAERSLLRNQFTHDTY